MGMDDYIQNNAAAIIKREVIGDIAAWENSHQNQAPTQRLIIKKKLIDQCRE